MAKQLAARLIGAYRAAAFKSKRPVLVWIMRGRLLL